MLADPLTISPDSPTVLTTNQVSFSSIKVSAEGIERLNSATDLSLPEKLIIKHQQTGKAVDGSIVDRHLISFSRVEADAALVAYPCVVNCSISVPRCGLFTSAEVTRQLAMLANFILASGNVAKILQNQS